MSNCAPVHSSDLAVAWGRAIAALTEPGAAEISPLIVTISDFPDGFPQEDRLVRGEVDAAIARAAVAKPRLCPVEVTANTIFPESLWLRHRGAGRQALFEHYARILPRLKKQDRRNHKGTYFSRLIHYGASGKNQLAHVLDSWDSGTHRRSALQIVIFDPEKDHTRQPFLGFPCLDYITFTPDTQTGTLSLMALYAEQYIFDRGYGNYLGLCRLGRFVAGQMGLRFARLTCIASCAKLGEAINKREAQSLVRCIEQALQQGRP